MQQVVLQWRQDGALETADDDPVVVARMPPEALAAGGAALAPGKLLRFNIGPGGLQVRSVPLPCEGG